MKRQVVEVECDHCHTIVQIPVPKGNERSIPKDWLHVSLETDTTTIYELDLCPKDKVSILNSAGKGVK